MTSAASAQLTGPHRRRFTSSHVWVLVGRGTKDTSVEQLIWTVYTHISQVTGQVTKNVLWAWLVTSLPTTIRSTCEETTWLSLLQNMMTCLGTMMSESTKLYNTVQVQTLEPELALNGEPAALWADGDRHASPSQLTLIQLLHCLLSEQDKGWTVSSDRCAHQIVSRVRHRCAQASVWNSAMTKQTRSPRHNAIRTT